jgi:protein-tyrosine phosphatase
MATEVAPHVWFGPAGVTHTEPTRFTHIFNVEAGPNSTANAAIQHVGVRNFYHYPCEDDDDFPILDRYLDRLCTTIKGILTENPDAKIYIHCVMGINRSAALALGYACETLGRDPAELIGEMRVKSRRLILLNKGFVTQLYARFM